MSDRSERQLWPARGAGLHPRGVTSRAPAIPFPPLSSTLMAIPNPTARAVLTGGVAVPQADVPPLPAHQAGRSSRRHI
jgi:hypothetical protein